MEALMNERGEVADRSLGCPFATLGGEDVHTAPFYCRFPDGKIHVPDRDRRRRLCFSGAHRWCPFVWRYGAED